MRGNNDKPGDDLPYYLPEDEYDRYLNQVLKMITAGEEKSAILEFLSKVEREYLMLTNPRGNKFQFLEELTKAVQRNHLKVCSDRLGQA